MNLETERVLTTEEAARHPSVSRPVTAATIRNWHRAGVAGVKLEGRQIGGRLVTTDKALVRFLDALNSRGKDR